MFSRHIRSGSVVRGNERAVEPVTANSLWPKPSTLVMNSQDKTGLNLTTSSKWLHFDTYPERPLEKNLIQKWLLKVTLGMGVYWELFFVFVFGETYSRQVPQLCYHGLTFYLTSNWATMTQNARPWTISLSQCRLSVIPSVNRPVHLKRGVNPSGRSEWLCFTWMKGQFLTDSWPVLLTMSLHCLRDQSHVWGPSQASM